MTTDARRPEPPGVSMMGRDLGPGPLEGLGHRYSASGFVDAE